ncbi:MAG: MotA/TolQ/ExbB proton channel family protein [Bacteroidota bacterium]|nr:MotA/TolQ/ExbB proton channel family protein [Bacteroidota bacterium]MDX5427095.1 MotA/TolQ/ExbB proton channel family protein [Bacteroidota bacterium]MDX5448540.1 MotA/TolQ/ExbB proton channel family protein [Bacteroidota bacterium]MDX5505063.1 MotA/TolQ/ExbB proton channel family protein [Bacteroidota bacterium]
MKKALSLLVLSAMLSFGAYAQDEAMENAQEQATEEVDSAAQAAEEAQQEEAAAAASMEQAAEESAPATEEASDEDRPFTQVLKKYFIDGGAFFMSIVLVALILGLAIVIERILYLTFSITNNEKLLKQIDDALNSGGIESAKEVCRSNRGPTAAIFYEGLDHYEEGLDMVDKSIIATGSVENGKLEKGVSWISLFIALAPMLGFMGTVIGMIQAFDSIEAAGDISPSLVAGGIKVALLTTVFGLIVAIILQIFYNLIIAMIDNIVIKMEDASISFMDMMVEYKKKNG